MPLYCTADEVKTLNQDPDMDDAVLDLLIAPVCEGIDTYCRQSFEAVEASRLYDYAKARELRLREPLLELDEVTTNAGQTFDANDFILEPYSGPPFYKLKLKANQLFNWSGSAEQAITVTGTWGWSATVPAGVKTAAILWVSDLYATADTRGLTSIGGGGIKAALKQLKDGPSDDVKPFLAGHISIRIEALSNDA